MSRTPRATQVERVSVAVIGGGQSGLAMSYHLMRWRVDHVVLEASERIGASWRNRWDSLGLITPARYDGLPGMPFPAGAMSFPTKDEMAAYLETYASHFELPVRLGSLVTGLARGADSFRLRLGDYSVEAQQVVIATGPYQKTRVPAYSSELDPAIVQLNAGEYRNPQQLKPGPVLVVGAGNSGAEISIEAARAGHRTLLAGPDTGHVPRVAFAFQGRIFWFLVNNVMSVNTPIGRKAMPRVIAHGRPLGLLSMNDVIAAGVVRVPRVCGVKDGSPLLEDGEVSDVRNIVWCTGFVQDYSWIEMPVLDARGLPRHDRGVVPGMPGLYFIGLPFLSKLASAFIGGVGDDARHLAGLIASAASVPSGRSALGSSGGA